MSAAPCKAVFPLKFVNNNKLFLFPLLLEYLQPNRKFSAMGLARS
jgi:hypothetical protein